jgi:hypothetical protein
MRTLVPQLTIILVLSACATQPPSAPIQFLDENTGASLFVVALPLEFARERSDVAAHARDYATLVAVAEDKAGAESEYLLLYRWSTVDPRMSSGPGPDAGELWIAADGRVLDLRPVEPFPADMAPRPELLQPAHAGATVHAYRTDWATLRYLAASHVLLLRMPQESLDTPFALRVDGRRALTEFGLAAHPGQ